MDTFFVRLDVAFVFFETHTEIPELINSGFNVVHDEVENCETCGSVIGLTVDEEPLVVAAGRRTTGRWFAWGRVGFPSASRGPAGPSRVGGVLHMRGPRARLAEGNPTRPVGDMRRLSTTGYRGESFSNRGALGSTETLVIARAFALAIGGA